MQTIAANTASQVLYLTLNEARLTLPVYTDYLLILSSDLTDESFALIPVLTAETVRFSTLTIGTDVNNAVNGSIEILQGGRYLYQVYGQNSSTNLDPEDASVVGEVEQGWIVITDTIDFYDQETTTLEADSVAQ